MKKRKEKTPNVMYPQDNNPAFCKAFVKSFNVPHPP